MLNSIANAVMVSAVEKGAGVRPVGPLPATLLTTGATLALTRGRRPIGLALLALGGALLWYEHSKAEHEALSAGS